MAAFYKPDTYDFADAIAQPGRTVTENADGTLEGVVEWIYTTDVVSAREAIALETYGHPSVAGACSQCSPGSQHPDDPRLECYEREMSYENGMIKSVASYFGLSATAEPVIEYKGSVNVVPIERHPDWNDKLSTYAVLDPIGLFIGFEDFEETDGDYKNLYGAKDYMAAGTSITITYWMAVQPIAATTGKIYTPSEDGLIPPLPDGQNYLLINQTYRQIGSFYQVTEEYLASGAEGWNATIYQGSAT